MTQFPFSQGRLKAVGQLWRLSLLKMQIDPLIFLFWLERNI